MAFNPAKQAEALNSPVERASNLNDPQFENQQGYFSYDLTHQEFITPLFGQITPTMHLDTVPADRTVVHDNSKLILNQINGNFLSTINQYTDSFYVPLRNVFPNNYEKLIPNPVKGEDIPNSALPVVPLLAYFRELYMSTDGQSVMLLGSEADVVLSDVISEIRGGTALATLSEAARAYLIGRITFLATILSRGQLLDYLGFNLDVVSNNLLTGGSSRLQYHIDRYFSELWKEVKSMVEDNQIQGVRLSLFESIVDDSDPQSYFVQDLSTFRSALSDIFEAGRFPVLPTVGDQDLDTSLLILIDLLDAMFSEYDTSGNMNYLRNIDALESMDSPGHINIGKILAYQQVVAHYYTNDHVDNIFSSDLFMQNLRSVMYPSDSYATTEPTFEMNGVRYEYDYISYGGFYASLLANDFIEGGLANRQYVFGTLMFLLRRSLRFGDYFSTARPNMLAVSDQLSIAVSGGQVSPIDVTKNLLMQRYLNAANYIGQGFLQYMSSIYGVKPSDTGCIPRFISHRKIELQNQITNNTSNNQGAQTTNLVGYSDANAFDVFIDDFGYLISLTSFDVLPVYKSGIDNSYHFADRFDYFNPMLQGIGDQPIRSSELLGFPDLYTDVFGYTMRNAEYKYKISKAHGAFINSLPGFMVAYPLQAYQSYDDPSGLNINPDFIRDKPIYLDPVIPQMTGISPAEYYHFVISCTNQVLCARKIQATPGVLF